MVADKVIHFGFFVRRERDRRNWSRTKFIAAMKTKVGPESRLSEKRLFEIEKMPDTNGIYERTVDAIARTLDREPQIFDREWRSTPVEPYDDGAEESPSPIGPLSLISPEQRTRIEALAREWNVTPEAAALRLIEEALRHRRGEVPAIVPAKAAAAGRDVRATIEAEQKRAEEKEKQQAQQNGRKDQGKGRKTA